MTRFPKTESHFDKFTVEHPEFSTEELKNYLADIPTEALQPRKSYVWRRLEGEHLRKVKRRRVMLTGVVAAACLTVILVWRSQFPIHDSRLHESVILLTADGQKINLSNANGSPIEAGNLQMGISSGSVKNSPHASTRAVLLNRLIVPRGMTYRMTLSDGSIVVLNSCSQLEFPAQFADNRRQVNLSGEAWFEVTHDPNHPFMVEASDLHVRVLGTRFNVKNYPGECASAVLETGSVECTDPHSKNQVILTPGQFAQTNSEGEISVGEADVQALKSWMHGEYRFSNATLKEISLQLERWHNIHFNFSGDSLAQYRFSGRLRRDYSIEQAVEILSKSTYLDFKINGDQIIVQ